MSLQLQGAKPLYGTNIAAVTMLSALSSSISTTLNTILDLNEIVRQSLLSMAGTQPPSKTAATLHWLAVQGSMPEIPQNVVLTPTTTTTTTTGTATAVPAVTGVTATGIKGSTLCATSTALTA
ncbi:hypothetical protein ACA910_006990 [Epithemia clementina (nom. ined.)]